MDNPIRAHALHRAVLLAALALVASLWTAPTALAQPSPEQRRSLHE